MASNELIIDDDYCSAMGSYIEKQGKEMDRLIADYISILQEVRRKAITGGEVAKTLNTYITYVRKLNNQIGNISTSTKTQIENFLSRVDAEDKYLF